MTRAMLFAVLLGCAQLHEPLELERDVAAVTVAAWKAHDYPPMDGWCHIGSLVIREHLTEIAFRHDCWYRPTCAGACQIWDWDGRDVNPMEYPVAVISPEAKNGAVPALAIHELLHAMLDCSTGNPDHKHAMLEVWLDIEGEAKDAFYGGRQ